MDYLFLSVKLLYTLLSIERRLESILVLIQFQLCRKMSEKQIEMIRPKIDILPNSLAKKIVNRWFGYVHVSFNTSP